jgi:predicted transcriptional regulator
MAALIRLDERAVRSGAQLIVLTSEAALEDVFGCLERSHPQIVVGGRQSEGLIALGAALSRLQGRRVREMDEEDRLAFLKLTEQLGRLSDRLDRFESGTARLESPAPEFRGEGGDGRRRVRPALPDARLVHRIIHQRRLRGKFLSSDLFADPAWDILLDLTAARVEHRRVSVTSLCIAAGVPATTALRWIGQMLDLGLLVREQDDQDRRRAFIDLSEEGAAAMARYFAALEGDGGQLS